MSSKKDKGVKLPDIHMAVPSTFSGGTGITNTHATSPGNKKVVLPRTPPKVLGRSNMFSSAKKRKQSLNLLGIVERSNEVPSASTARNRSQHFRKDSPALATAHPGTARQANPSSGRSVSLRSQLHQLDSGMLRTFDSKTGSVSVKHRSAVPKRSQLIRHHYAAFWKDEKKIRDAEELVGRLSVAQRKQYAVESIRRKHEEELQRILKKDVFDAEVALRRVNVSLQMALEHIIGHLGSDTRELSLIRMQAAAADTVLYKEAERVADAEIQHFNSTVIPPGTTAVELMSLAMDSYRERFVPPPPRQFAKVTEMPASSSGRRGSARMARRPSGIYRPPPVPSDISPSQAGLTTFGVQPWAKGDQSPSTPTSRSLSISAQGQGFRSGFLDTGSSEPVMEKGSSFRLSRRSSAASLGAESVMTAE